MQLTIQSTVNWCWKNVTNLDIQIQLCLGNLFWIYLYVLKSRMTKQRYIVFLYQLYSTFVSFHHIYLSMCGIFSVAFYLIVPLLTKMKLFLKQTPQKNHPLSTKTLCQFVHINLLLCRNVIDMKTTGLLSIDSC